MPDPSEKLGPMPSYKKLNWRQRGFWQQIFSIISVLISGAIFCTFWISLKNADSWPRLINYN